MPFFKRKPFVPNPPPSDLKGDEEVFFLRLTNEIFRDYDEYFAQVIQCNSLIWSCSLTGKSGLTFQEALESERSAKKFLKGFPRPLKKALFYLATLTKRGRFSDVVEDVLTYARERYFKGEEVFSVIGNMWCPSKVISIIAPTPAEMEQYKQDQIEKGLEDKNDYLTDDSWGPAPDLFRYEVQEIDPDNKTPTSSETHVLEAIDVKREKTILTRDKCRILLKLATDMIDEKGLVMVKPIVITDYGLQKAKYDEMFIGKTPIFEESPAPVKPVKDSSKSSKSKTPKEPKKEKSSMEKEKSKSGEKKAKSDGKEKKSTSPANKTAKAGSAKSKAKPEAKSKKPKVEKQLTQQELKQLEMVKKAKEREKLKAQKKLVADFKKLWFKPKEDLEVEDLKDLPIPDPVCCKIPNNLFGEFMMLLEFLHCYSSTLKVRDCFPSGVTFDILERALTKNEVAGPFSDILQLLMKTIFRLQETENAEITEVETATVDFEVNDVGGDVTAREAVQLATAYSTWSMMYQNTPLHKLGVDHLSITEVLRLHLLSSGAKPSEKDVKWRTQQRGGYTETDDPGLQLRLEEPQIIKSLNAGTVFDLTMREKLKLVQCLINQISTYVSVRDAMEESFDQLRLVRANLKSLQVSEKKKDAEDNYWRQKLKADKLMPDMTLFKAVPEKIIAESQDGENDQAGSKNGKGKEKPPEKPSKPPMTDEQIEAALAKKDKEIARRKQDFLWKEDELQEQLHKQERRLGIHPVGKDRAFRRYWTFSTVGGLFVEHDDEYVGDCLPAPTPFIANVDFDNLSFVKETYDKYLQMDKEGSDKENSISNSPKKSKKKASMSSAVKKEVSERPAIFGMCTGDKESCPVHCIYLPRPKWSFFWNPEHIDALIENLSPRGIREKELRSALVEEKDPIKAHVNKCPALKLNREGQFPEHISNAPDKRPQRGGTTQKNRIDPNLSYPAGTNIETILELQLRDLILEVEEKIFLGALGSVKVSDRGVWRKALEDREYDPQASKLSWTGGKSLNVAKRHGRLNGNSAGEGTSKSDQLSSHTSTSSEANKDDSTSLNPVVKDLACAILQIRQSIEPKFLKRPLGEEDGKKKKSKEAELSSKISLPAPTAIERWELSLMACTSFSQLFVHLFTFDNSVEWSRSVLNARCRVCRRKGNPENMLLCDGCNKGHHAYCLKPPLEVIPKGDWFCYDCKPIELPPPKPRSRARRLSDDDDILQELDRNDSDDENGRSNDLSEEVEQEGCAVCSFGGELMCCDGCPDMYHLLCLNPPLSRVPRGIWHCPNCKSQAQKGKSSSRSKNKSKARRTISTDESDEDTLRSDDESEPEASSRSRNHSDDETDRATDDDDESDKTTDDEREVVKVKFTKKPTERTSGNNRKRVYEDDEDYESEDDHHFGRGSRRKCASQAAAKIAQVAKRLRSDSKENESSDNSNDSSSSGFQAGSRSKRSNELEMYDSDAPKRTRLQRMNTNNCVRNGELDNVLLDKILSEVMKQAEAWPFLKPVTRNEAPDYHEIVKHPMDLGTIKYKLNSMVYTCNEEFISDLLLVFSNCEMYNDPSSRIHQAGRTLKSFCERKFSKIGITISDS
ncbi:Bromodomain adjacent to zinc finger domain protein 1A [Orchesella cincta]|uniref:Bromodomain adjacent to zinc finger domain protein 1A n=1 Tax=Orchesella cincta TaxID=48709 RepID=A0A1D2N196_ORCCI|nr:Bromodomain adjacent to zinc finger domain protein 1A [Orchesella cincta]